ncbi:MAG TPA: ABC transporter ATP-binding protein [Eubacteriales bacterium]|nr:ABC transporter ATP-binding protein [Clostridia bacterium]HRV73556.1 ABC transporter ATP-binding protein [Eubacteriales bacterium]
MKRLKRFLAYYKPHKKLLALDMSCATAVSLIDLCFPLLTQYILKTLLPEMQLDKSLLTVFVVLLVAAFFGDMLRAGMQYIVAYWGHMLGVRIEADMRGAIFSHIQKLSFNFYDHIRTGKLLSRVTNDLFEITELAHHGPEDVLISSLTLIGALIVMFFIQWQIALVLTILLPIMLVFVMKARVAMKTSSKNVKEKVAEINAGVESSISGARVAKAFANEHYEIEKFKRGNNEFLVAKKSFYKAMAVFQSGMDFFIALFNIAVLGVGGLLIYHTKMDAVVLVTFTLYVASFTSPIKRLANFAEQYVLGMSGFTRFLEILDTEPQIKDAKDAVTLKDVKGDIDFNDVSFAYDGGDPVLSHVSLTVPHGKTIALVGPSGGGKTTMCHLLLRFYDVTGGGISVDGHDIRQVTTDSLRRNIGIVQQDVFLFAGSILDNIRYGRLDATDEEVVEAAKRAHIHDEVIGLENGYDTNVGERGIMLSGGQKQRISIARLFLKNPPILVLDEATSALDSLTETDIQHSFEALAVGRTTLVIAHRLSTVRNADEIIVIDEKGIRERGTHDALLKREGLYATFYEATLTK